MSAENNQIAVVTPQINREEIARVMGLDLRQPSTQAMMIACEKYGLDPILKHAIVIPNKGLYVTRDGLMHVAHASGKLDGVEAECTGETANHFVARAVVYRKDMGRPFVFQGRYPKTGQLAKTYGPEMAEKVAICRALRHAFDVSLCSKEETWEEDLDDAPKIERPARQVQAPPQSLAPTLSPETEAAMQEFAAVAHSAGYGIGVLDSGKFSPKGTKDAAFAVFRATRETSNWQKANWLAPDVWIHAKAALVEKLAAEGTPSPEPAPIEATPAPENLGDLTDPFGPDEENGGRLL